MSADATFLAALQLSDSGLPIGRFAHSFGLEALITQDQETTADELVEIVATHVLESAGPLDGVAVAAAHRLSSSGDLAGLLELDRLVHTRKLAPMARLASTTCGRRLAALTPLFTDLPPAAAYCAAARDEETPGHLAVVHGVLAQAVGLGQRQAVLMELRGTAATLLSALVRLGRLSAVRAQAILRELTPVLEFATTDAESAPAQSMHSAAFELETFSLIHRRNDARHFIT